jgi:hypothetical protein
LHNAGAKMVWSDSASVKEFIPPERLDRRYLLRRTYAGAQTYVRVALRTRQFGEVVRTCAIAAGYAVIFALPSIVISGSAPAPIFRIKRRTAQSLGKLSALLGLRVQLYGREDQTPLRLKLNAG